MEPSPNSPSALTSEEIFRQAIATNAEIHKQALADMQRQAEEIHASLRSMVSPQVTSPTLPDYQLVQQATIKNPGFWPEVIAKAKAIIEGKQEASETPLPFPAS